MACDNLANVIDIYRSMVNYPWLKYPKRSQEFKKVMTPMHLPQSSYKVPTEEFPPKPECWRPHPNKSNSVPYCYHNKPEIYTHWHTLYDPRWEQERESQKMLRKMRDHFRYSKEDSPISSPFYLPINKLAIKPQMGPKPLDPTGDSLKWQRLKELAKKLNSPREDEQCYAAQALGRLGISDKCVMEALGKVAQTGPEKVKYEACRTLAILGCLNKHVIQVLIQQLKGGNEEQRLDTLKGLRQALNIWSTVSKDKIQVGDEGKLVTVLQMLIKKSLNEAAVEAALCLGFLRPCSNMAQELLLQCLCQEPKTQRMKALRMLVKMMHVHSAIVIRAILDQLCYSRVLEHRFEATQMLRTIGLEQIQAQGLEVVTFDLLRKRIYNEPFLAIRQAVAETVDELKMKPMLLNLVEAQLMDSNANARLEAVISLGALGIRSSQMFHLLLDMLDVEKNQLVKKSLQETLILLTSIDPWVQNKLKNKIFFVYEEPKSKKNTMPTRFRKEPENPEDVNIQDFKLAQLNPLFITKSSTIADQQRKLTAQKGSVFSLNSALPCCFSKSLKHKSRATGPWVPTIRKQLQMLSKSPK
ncbi:protein HEATR9 isoform X2 [Talpa occidentalis]|uniref:protein HEATR9 isoform X2 n=1 Tax=Talpa occidentalis TaxID=50954 RepID=UPI00188EA8B5|nr:protein HEATR9 isoform X2 [Talpa occidentalis]